MKIKNKGQLEKILYHEGYNVINIDSDGVWYESNSSKFDMININRVLHHDLTRKGIKKLLEKIESEN